MGSLITLLLIWFVISGLGDNRKKQRQQTTLDELRRVAEQYESTAESEVVVVKRESEAKENNGTESKRSENKGKIEGFGKTVIFGDLGEFVREFVELMTDSDEEFAQKSAKPQKAEPAQPIFAEMTDEDIARRKAELAQKRNRRLSRQKAEVAATAEQCDYCTGEAEVASTIEVHTPAAKPVIIADRPSYDVTAAVEGLKLSPMQQAVVWTEILDRPLAVRKRR